MTDTWNEQRFRENVDRALKAVRTVLDTTRHPQYAADVEHRYADKYELAEFLTRTAVAAQLNCLEQLGLSGEKLAELQKLAGKRSATLRLSGEERCAFDREVTRKVESATQHVTEYKSSSGAKATRTDKVVTTVTEYFWRYNVRWELFAYAGNSPEQRVLLQERSSEYEIMTSSKSTPRPQVAVVPAVDTSLSWLLAHVAGGKVQFDVQRSLESCHTPRRNRDVDAALRHGNELHRWAEQARQYFVGRLFPVQTGHGLDLSVISADGLFVPVVPLFEAIRDGDVPAAASESSSSASSSSATSEQQGSGVVVFGDVNQFLAEEVRSLQERNAAVAKALPDAKKGKLISVQEGQLCVALLHVRQVCQQYADGVDYIEDMLRKQLIAAIGKVVGPVEFANYMEYHYRKLYRGEFEPRLFSYAVRRPDHYPEGVLSIEAELADGSLPQPIRTVVRRREAAHPMRFAINAATDVSFFGERYLHAWMSHQFSGQSGTQLNLVARARQFSSFILLVGRISSAEVFDPKAAIIIQNKDDLKLPLMLETIPSAKEFKDAIASLSPEQQRFAKAFRGMQLESTLFGICVIQIKPQLEKLLNLPNDGLTKEIKLTQNLMELFITYQIPSDLLSYDGDQAVSLAGKLTKVKGYVQAMYDMINECKAKELAEKQQEAEYARAQRIREGSLENQGSAFGGLTSMLFGSGMGGGGGPGGGGPARGGHSGRGGGGMALGRRASGGGRGGGAPSRGGHVQHMAAINNSLHNMQLRGDNLADLTGAPPSKPSTTTSTTAHESPTDSADSIPGAAEPESSEDLADDLVDYTQVPQQLEQQFEKLDTEGALRPTIINPGKSWRKKAQKALLAKPTESVLNKEGQKEERNQAYDLLDALSRSGSLAVDEASLHVVVAATHCFDKTLVDTVVQDNVNPIEKVERSSLIMAATVQERAPIELIKPSQVDRVRTYSPGLFEQV